MLDPAKLNADNITFVFIDLQQRLLARIPDSEKLVARNILVLECARALEIPMLVTTQYRKGLGELSSNFRERVCSVEMDKTAFSCLADEKIREEIMRLGRDWAVLCGVETHICVLQTALDLIREGYRVAVVVDATGAHTPLDVEIGLKRLKDSGALLITAEMLIYELLGRSDTENFKKLLPLIKEM